MWTLPKQNNFLPVISLQKLKELYAQEKNSKAKVRLLAAIHRKQGKSIDDISYLLSMPRNTVYGWLRRFARRGIDAKNSIKQSGRPVELTVQQRAKLIKMLERGPPHNPSGLWSSKEVREVITKKFKRTYVKQHVWRLLVSLGFSMQRPRKRHYQRPSEAEIDTFKKKVIDKRVTIERKDLLWARKMKQPSVSSPS